MIRNVVNLIKSLFVATTKQQQQHYLFSLIY